MELASYRAEFPITSAYVHLNHAGMAPLNRRAASAIQQHLEMAQTVPFELLRPGLQELETQVKERAADLIGAARPDEIVVVQNTATGINIAANSLPLRSGDTVLVIDGDYPANIYPWLNLAPRGIPTKWVPQLDGGLDLDVLESRIDAHTRVIALSTAMFATGFRNDLAAVGALCKQRDIFFVVDAIQTLGAFSVDVQACGIDFLACGANKWLLGAPGAGLLYCRHDLLDRLQLGAYVGAISVVDAFNFLDYNFTLQSTSERFSVGVPNILGTIALNCALELLHEAGIKRISERIVSLTDTLIADLRDRGFRILSNLAPERRSGIVIVEVPDPQAACERLAAANVVASVRGGGIRFSPHFYNNEEDVLRAAEVLAGPS